MEHTIAGDYILLVLLSVIVILLTSFTVFDVSARMFHVSKRKRGLWLIVGSLTMGGGIWALHFIGMLAYMPTTINYNIMTLSISFAITVFSSFITLLIVSQDKVSKNNFVFGCLLMSASLVGMHYIGMKSIHMNAAITYNPLILLLSVLIAFIPSVIFYKVIYDIRIKETILSMHTKLFSGILVGLSISVMHYTAMFGTEFTYHLNPVSTDFQTINASQLATFIGIGSIFMVILVIISSYLSVKFSNQTARLKVNEQYYKSLFKDNSEAIVLFDLKGHFEDYNKSVNEIFGYSFEELFHENFISFVIPEDQELSIQQFSLAAAGTVTTSDTSVLHKDGYQMDFRVKNIPVIVEGKVVGVFGIFNDITESKQAKEALIEAESKYRSLVEQSIMGVYIMQDEKIVYSNPRLEEILGYSQEELSVLQLKDYVYEEDIPIVTKNISNRMNKSIQSIRYEYRAIKKDGTMAYLEVHGSTARYRGENAVIGTIVDITDRKKAEETIQYMSYYDYLTGLPNSNFLTERLVELVQDHKEAAVLLLELDRLKTIKDTVGQETGNSLVLLASERIKQLLGDENLLTRWQEDKFVILLPDTDHERTTQIAKTILDVIAQPLKNIHHDVYVNPSIGISMYPNDSNTTETLLDMANSALHYAKKHGNNSYHFYTPDLDGKSRESLELEMELYRAIELDELTLHYQPQFHLSTGEYIGNEALIRWNHPKRGLVSPFHFIPLAEEIGLIIPIGEWVLKTACTQNKAWQMAGFPPIVVSVNLSARQFAQTNLVEVVERILAETKLDAKYLDLEITESMTMDVDRTISILQALKKVGVKISMDDFGTGYSSLSYLNKFPIDSLKIDQSFIRDCHLDQSNATIVKTIISMAHHLNIQVIAEGVETKEHLDFLQQNLCDAVQGYLLSKPIPAEKIEVQFLDLQNIISRFGLTIEFSHRLWLERELEITKQELQKTIRQQDGMTLKYKLKDGKLIHTMCDGELIYRMGLSPEKVVGKELAEIFPLEKAVKNEAFYRRAWQGEENVSYEGHESGIVYLATLRPVFRMGKVVEVIASCVDITERKRVEEALRYSEINYRLIAENTSDIITVVDKNGIVLYTSPSCEIVSGYSIDQLNGLSGFLYIYPDDLPLIENIFSEIMLTKTSNLVQYRIIHKNKSLINVEAKITPVLGDDGEIEHFIVVIRDITEQKKAEDHLRKWERLSVAGELAAGVAHEIRNPLTSIKGFLQLLDKSEIAAEYCDIMLKDVNQVESIINEFLALAKPEAALYKPTDLKGILAKVVTLIESEAHLKNIIIESKITIDHLFMNCDENKMKQVFLNIIINAIESMSYGGVVKVSMEKKDEESVIVLISDQGCGMTEDRVKKLGEPFYSNKEKGTGLGLMSSYKIIHEHKGEIFIESKINSGTIVEIKIPLIPDSKICKEARYTQQNSE
ncbi:PAS domain S-box protein [Paenisporosarcina antarctica]|uniref:histidine kinase n=1 Tax=Paenisporosarcina antarctica TaxID=417367 RepID=A0A4P7A212_9BACL|nr:EAL domain-containing protein [Paenisporosarcina antarctica]QBP42668.1 PAS domain S-box protein [Paenisporosarcina antarctica]